MSPMGKRHTMQKVLILNLCLTSLRFYSLIIFVSLSCKANALFPFQKHAVKSVGGVSRKLARDDNIVDNIGTKGGWVQVKAKESILVGAETFSCDAPLLAASDRARKGWLEFQWEKGGGLPIVVIEKNRNNNCTKKERLLLPILMQERTVSYPRVAVEDEDKSSIRCLSIDYTLNAEGPLFPHIVHGTHFGRVNFTSSYDPENTSMIITTMDWEVKFETTSFVAFYEWLTAFTVGTACRTVLGALQTPRLLTLTTQLYAREGAIKARREWLDFVFSFYGGGLPLPPPIPFGEILHGGGGKARQKLLRFPPGLVETVISELDYSVGDAGKRGDEHSVQYCLENPGWWTFPFLVHTHLGQVTFRDVFDSPDAGQSNVEFIWKVEIRPFRVVGPLVELLTEMTISTIARNLKERVESYGSPVDLGKPQKPYFYPFVLLRNDTWAGRVLNAHSNDTRSTLEQFISLLQPWDWGLIGDDVNDFECRWSNGEIDRKQRVNLTLDDEPLS